MRLCDTCWAGCEKRSSDWRPQVLKWRADSLGGWQNDNTQSFLADSTDLVGIGTSTPWAKLAINPLAGDANQFVVGSSTQTSFVITPSSKVGIGTSRPWAKLSVDAPAGVNSFATGSSTATYFSNTRGGA